MSDKAYLAPVDQLFTLDEVKAGPWPNYLELGLGPEHVTDLIRLATTYPPEGTEPQVESAVWMASVHAWRALGQLGAEAATQPLLDLVAASPHDEWVTDEVPAVFNLIGPSVIPALIAFLADGTKDMYSRTAAAEGLTQLAIGDPASREACVSALADHLAHDSGDDDDELELNGFIVTMLMRLKAVETAPMIEQAFAAKRIDESITGDWEDVQVELGLLEERLTRFSYSIHGRRGRQGYRPAEPAVTKTPKTKRRPNTAPGRGKQGKKKR